MDAKESSVALDEFEKASNKIQHQGGISEWNEDAWDLVESIGTIFRMGLYRGIAQMLIASTPSFWPFVRDFTAPGTIVEIKKLSKDFPLFSKQRERENAWIIYALNNKDFHLYFDTIKRNPKLAKVFYSKSLESPLLDRDALFRIEGIIGQIEKYEICLSLKGYVEYVEKRPQILKDLSQNTIIDIISKETETEESHSIEKDTLTNFESQKNDDKEEEIVAAVSEAMIAAAGVDFIEKMSPSSELTPSPSNKDKEELSWNLFSQKSSTNDDLEHSSSLHELSSSPTASKREPIYSSIHQQMSKAAYEEIMNAGKEEIQAIVSQGKGAKIHLVDPSLHSSIPFPVIIVTPSVGTSPSIDSYDRLEATPSPSEISDFGPFGLSVIRPELMSSWYNSIRGFTGRFERFILWLFASMNIDDSDDEITDVDLFFDPYTEEDSALAAYNRYGDGFHFDLTRKDDQGSPSSTCYNCDNNFNASDLNFCTASGYYFCNDCFNELKIALPSAIVNDWDFTQKSTHKEFTQEYNKHFKLSIINLPREALKLYEKVPELGASDEMRRRIQAALKYTKECNTDIDEKIRSSFVGREHLIEQDMLYTVNDLIALNEGRLMFELNKAFDMLETHIKEEKCVECNPKSSQCRLCERTDPIFGFDRDITECPDCHMISHESCFQTTGQCPNCKRVHMTIGSPSIDIPSSIDHIIVN